MGIKTLILGAGQEVGKSCVIVTLGGKRIMFDCGMHMGYQDERRYPDFSLISKNGNFTQALDCVIVTHFHLDHIGALPYFTEVCGYEGPIYMTYPTKALGPLMLEDYRKVLVDRRKEQEQFSVLQIYQCMKKVIAVDIKQTIKIGADLQIRAYYAGHVLGAAMFYVKVGESSVVYTGDYNMVGDKHLGPAQIDRLKPDLVITESTYATVIRDSRHARERGFLKAVHDCVANGGKVLIPVFALGRAQELCILLDEYWERMNLSVPIHFSAGLTMQANVYYKMLISWTNEKVRESYVTRNTFDFMHVSGFNRSQIDAPGPCVLFATPGMLSGGLSLEVFKRWAPSEKNMVVLPGYCIPGTVGFKLMSGKPTRVDIDKRTHVDVCCQIFHFSFSGHTDAKGIMDLLEHVEPRHVILVHGEKPKMVTLKDRIMSELGMPCFVPANNEEVEIPSRFCIKVETSKRLLSEILGEKKLVGRENEGQEKRDVEGIVVVDQSRNVKVIHPSETFDELGAANEHALSFSCTCPLYADYSDNGDTAGLPKVTSDNQDQGLNFLNDPPVFEPRPTIKRSRADSDLDLQSCDVEQEPQEERAEAEAGSLDEVFVLQFVYSALVDQLGDSLFALEEDCVRSGSFYIRVCPKTSAAYPENRHQSNPTCNLSCTWGFQDNTLANRTIILLKAMKIKVKVK